MNNKLRQYFPMIRTREEVLKEIKNNPGLLEIFKSWKQVNQEEFLDFCTGVKGVKMTYDSFFKEIMNPEYTPERLEELISLIIDHQVKILTVLPNDSTRIADETALVIMDIVVEFEDHSLANIEIQKIGYAFPGQRSACYSADLLLRQYKRVKDESDRKEKPFSFNNIKSVYTIVLFEKSQKEFHQFSDTYIHHFSQTSDTGLEIDLLQNYVFIPLDIFKAKLHNKHIESRLDAWLVFVCVDEPEWIVEVIEAYPQFKAMYRQVYEMCLNVERVMTMFSEELRQLDKNTVLYMIDEMQDEITKMGNQLKEKDEALQQKDEALQEKEEALQQKDEALRQNRKRLEQSRLEQKKDREEIEVLRRRIAELEGRM